MTDDIVEKIVMKGKAADEIRRLRDENEKLREALQKIAAFYNKPTTSKDALAVIAKEALKETGNE